MTTLERQVKALSKFKTFATLVVAFLLAGVLRADGLPGSYAYKLVVRDDFGFALSGCKTDEEDGRVTANCTIEVYDRLGAKINAAVEDVPIGVAGADYNCTLTVPVAVDREGYAKVGEPLTLVVRSRNHGYLQFQSSKILPPVGGFFGMTPSSIGVFLADEGDYDFGYELWRLDVESYGDVDIGDPDDDFDEDGLSNLCEYQLGTDPLGGCLWLWNTPGFTIVEQGNGYVVEFNCDPCHVYSVRAIAGEAAVGKDGLGENLELYDVDDHDAPCGKFVYEQEVSGTRRYFVRKPMIAGSIGLAVDGRLQMPVPVKPPETVPVTPGYPISYATEASAKAAKAIAALTPSDAVAATLTADGAADGYKAAFTVEVRTAGASWRLLAELTPLARTNLMENATAAARQIPVGALAELSADATTNVALTGCSPGFYYSLCSGATVTNVALDAETENLNVLCGANGEVTFPKVKKPSDDAGFFRIKIDVK